MHSTAGSGCQACAYVHSCCWCCTPRLCEQQLRAALPELLAALEAPDSTACHNSWRLRLGTALNCLAGSPWGGSSTSCPQKSPSMGVVGMFLAEYVVNKVVWSSPLLLPHLHVMHSVTVISVNGCHTVNRRLF
jgi:hypothetical protein